MKARQRSSASLLSSSSPLSPASSASPWRSQATGGRANAGDRARKAPESAEEGNAPLWALYHARCSEDVGQLNDAVMEASQCVSPCAYQVPAAIFGKLEVDKEFAPDKGRSQSYPSSSKTKSSRLSSSVSAVGEEKKKKKIEAAEHLRATLEESRKHLRCCRSELADQVIAALRDNDANAVAGRLYDARRAGFGPGLIKLLEQRLAWMHEHGVSASQLGAAELLPTRVRELTPKQASSPSPSHRTTPHSPAVQRKDVTLSHPSDNMLHRRARGKDGNVAMAKLEKKVVKEVFQKYDADGTGEIDLQELRSMLGDLGAALREDELESVMQALDVTGNGRCGFDEFLEWWTAKASERTVNQSVSLAFMKAKLATEMALRRARAELAQAEMKAVPAGEVSINGSLDISTKVDGCQAGMSAAVTLEHMPRDPDREDDALKVELRTKSEEVAANMCQCLEELFQILKFTGSVDVAPEHNKVILTVRLVPEMVDAIAENEESQVAASFLRRTFDKCELHATVGATFYDLISMPTLGVFSKMGGARLRFSSTLNQGSLMAFADEVLAPIVPCISGFDVDCSVGCDDEFFQEAVNALAKQCEDFFGPELAGLAPKSLSEQRGAVVGLLKGMFKDDRESLDRIVHAFRYMSSHVICVDSLSYTGLPGHSLALRVAFRDFNPFALAGFMVEPFVSHSQPIDALETSDAIRKTLSKEELERLRVAFDALDKDGSGAIDVKELQRMCNSLGGKLTKREAQEAMRQLDKDGNGKVDFENFAAFWSSKPGLGGYSSIALKFMKLKLAAGSFLGKSMSALANSTRRSVKAMLELRPGLQALDAKMSANCSLQASPPPGPAKEGEPLKLTLRLIAKPVAEAPPAPPPEGAIEGGTAEEVSVPARQTFPNSSTQLARGIRELMSEFHDSMEMLPEISVEEDGQSVSLSTCAPAELIRGLAGELHLEHLVPLVKQFVSNIGVSLSFGCLFEDFVNTPDVPLHQLLGGTCLTIASNTNPASQKSGGRTGVSSWFTDSFSDMQTFALRLFAAFDFSCRLRYDESKIAELLRDWGIIPDTAEAGLTLNDIKEIVASTMQKNMPSDMTPTVSMVRRLINCLEAVHSITLQGPMALSTGNETKVDLTAKFDNFNPFCLISYILPSHSA